jgi:DNA-binding PadR family transcriptional regulator
MAIKIDHALIDEYGLNPLNYRLLKLASKSDIQWNGPGLRAITTQPANGLRKLVERGLLSGPAQSEKITARPFSLTDQGRDTLARIERGLHRNDLWMSAGKLKVLELLTDGGPASHRQLLDRGAAVMSILSLLDAGYIKEFVRTGVQSDYHLTDLGREALAQWRAENAAVEVSSEY